MKYKVHRLEITNDDYQDKLEQFLNKLNGEVVSILPHLTRTTLGQIYGVKSKIDYLLITEKN